MTRHTDDCGVNDPMIEGPCTCGIRDRDRELEGLAERIAEALERSGALQDPPPLDGSGKEQREQGLAHVVRILRSAWAEREKVHADRIESLKRSVQRNGDRAGEWFKERDAARKELAERERKLREANDVIFGLMSGSLTFIPNAAREELAEAKRLLIAVRIEGEREDPCYEACLAFGKTHEGVCEQARAFLAAQPAQEGQPPATCFRVNKCKQPRDHVGPCDDWREAQEGQPGERWRVGRKIGRTVYQGDTLIGVMDTRELAAQVVAAVNAASPDPGPSDATPDVRVPCGDPDCPSCRRNIGHDAALAQGGVQPHAYAYKFPSNVSCCFRCNRPIGDPIHSATFGPAALPSQP